MATSSKVLISVKHLVKEYNHGTVHALDGCDLDIHKGFSNGRMALRKC